MESNLQSRTIKHANSIGLRAAKFVDQSRKGAPDLIIFFSRGFLIFIETKIGKNGLSEHQKDYHTTLKKEGFEVYTVYTFEVAQYLLNSTLDIHNDPPQLDTRYTQ